MKRLHLDWELQSMSPAIDGEYILYADHVEAMKRIAGEGREPVAQDQCAQDVFEHGESIGLFDIPKETANAICAGITAITGARVDWHYVGGRVHMKALAAPPESRQMVASPAALTEDQIAVRAGIPFVGLSVTLMKALRRLSFAAQTSGGVAGRDDELMGAIKQAQEALEAAKGKGLEEVAVDPDPASSEAASPADQGGWQPIETAPKDGTEILLFRGAEIFEGKPVAERVTSGAWIELIETASEYHATTGEYLGQSIQGGEASWMSWDGGFREDAPPTHWMPLPPAPAMSASKEGA